MLSSGRTDSPGEASGGSGRNRAAVSESTSVRETEAEPGSTEEESDRPELEPDAWSSQLWSRVRDDELAVLTGHQRAELSTLQERIVRADAKAAGVVSATIAVAAVGATGLAALPHGLSTADKFLVGFGALFLVLALGGAVQIRDTAEKHNPFGAWVVEHFEWSEKLIDPLLEWRAAVSHSEPEFPLDRDPMSLQRAIARGFTERINAAVLLQDRMNRQAQLATLVLTAGIGLLTLSAVLILNGV